MALHLITGYAGTEHVTASNAGALNAASFGTGNKVFNLGKKFEYNLESNNTIRIKDGQGIMNGRHFELAPGTYEDLSIENGAQSSNRKDLVVARYTIDTDTGVESMALKVITGTPSSGTAVDPDYNSGSIIDGDTTVDFPLYRINIIGLNVDSIDTLFSIQENVEDLLGNTSISTIGNGTVTGAISQINTNLSERTSHVGMIIQTTTLDTEDKIKAIYGGTSWTRLDDMFLVGAGTKYNVNSTGGSADAAVVSHYHSVKAFTSDGGGSHNHYYGNASKAYITYPGQGATCPLADDNYTRGQFFTNTVGNHTHSVPEHNTKYSGESGANKNLPPYKAVFIWERIS